MKKILFFSLLAAIVAAGCQPKVQPEPVDLNSVKDSVSFIVDKWVKAYNDRDIATASSLFANEGKYFGTDPAEIWDIKETIDLMTKQFADTSFNWIIVIDNREVIVSPDGKSAIVSDQFTINAFSPKIPIREIAYLANEKGKWLIYYSSWNFLLKNEDISRINKVLE